MAEGRGAYVAAFVVIIIIILLLIFFFCSGCGSGSSVLSCLKACRFCATAKSDQIQLGPCCEAKITNSVGQKTTYTLPDPGADAATILLSVGEGQTVNGSGLVLSGTGTGTVAASAVTVNGPSGSFDVALGALAAGASLADITLTNSSIKTTSQVFFTVTKLDAQPTNANAAAYVMGLLIAADGAMTLRVNNGGSAAFDGQTATVSFLVIN